MASSSPPPPPPPPHFVLFPFMSKGHVIPLLHLARLLIRRGVSVTIFTTSSNSPHIRLCLSDTNASVIDLPFPQNVLELPPGIESTDKLPSMSLFLPFARATKQMQPVFEQTIHRLRPTVDCIISDAFLVWVNATAKKLGIPRFVFHGMNNFAMSIYRVLALYKPHAHDRVDSNDESFDVPRFPWIRLTRNDLEEPFNDPDPKGPMLDFVVEQVVSDMDSKGYISNSFYELEPRFVDFWNKECGPKSWCVGPLNLAEPAKAQPREKPVWIQWLDDKLTSGRSVLYVAFGSQAEISEEQLGEIAKGLEGSEVNFLWVVRSNGSVVLDGFRERVGDRGLVVCEWVDQVEILSHKSVNGFMSHCGWNSVLESVCASVPILAWPMMAEQHMNARMVVDELCVGVRVLARNGSVRGFVGWECIEMMVRELMEGDKGKEVRKKVKEMGELARNAIEEGGSSWQTLDLLISEVCDRSTIVKR